MPTFDIERFVDLSGAVQLDDLPWEAAAAQGITPVEARVLRYMADTETHTILYLRDLLAGHTCHDPELTSFLAVWVYEELWHGRAIDRLLSAAGYPPPADTYRQVSQGVSLREPLEAMASHLVAWATPRFAAVHMTWGAINELTAAAAYRLLGRSTQNDALRTLLGRIGKQERKHYAFYASQAEKRLAGDVWAQRLCRATLRLVWTPVGAGLGPAENLAFVAHHLFDNAEGRRALHDVDETIAGLPGLGSFDLVTRRVGAIMDQAQGMFDDDGMLVRERAKAQHAEHAQHTYAPQARLGAGRAAQGIHAPS